MISYDKKMKNQIGYRDSLHDEYDEGRLSIGGVHWAAFLT